MADFTSRFDQLVPAQPDGGQFPAAIRPISRQKPWKKGQKAWEMPQPASPQLKAMAAFAGAQKALERRERLIVLTFVNHPDLLQDFLDDYAAAEFASRELDSLRTQIIDIAALEQGLDGEAQGPPVVTRLWPCSGPPRKPGDAFERMVPWSCGCIADARTGLRQMFALHRKTVTLDRELKAAEAAFAADPTEENFNALSGCANNCYRRLAPKPTSRVRRGFRPGC